jgi:hypothetical protein
MEFGGRYHVQGTAKICLPKEAVISSLSAVYELVPEGKWKSYLFTRVSSNLPTFLGGIQLKAFYLTNVPPIFGKKIFTVPWTTTDAFGFPIEFFHSFPFSKGETLSPPFGKGRVGGISGGPFQTAD